ncbi:MAG: hypothetical protein HYZ48_04965, partial [Chlamydiales bacterium]|nr:hypothetical protein [Chlamydiales bacterium]
MIHHLSIKNIALIDNLCFSIPKGFTALTGETGEAWLTITCLPKTQKILSEAGIEYDLEEDLVVRREISKEGKSRAFVNGQLVPLSLLQKISSTLLELIEQHSYHILTSTESQKEILDRFAGAQSLLEEFQKTHSLEMDLKKKQEELLEEKKRSSARTDLLLSQIEEIESLKLKSSEEEKEISQEHSAFANSAEILEKLSPVLQTLSHLLPSLHRSCKTCDSLSASDEKIKTAAGLLRDASIAMTDAHHDLTHYTSLLDSNPNRFAYLEERLSMIESCKRKYGRSIEEILQFEEKAKLELQRIENFDFEIETLCSEIRQIQELSNTYANKLSTIRKERALLLGNALTESLQLLNMPGSRIEIVVEKTKRSLSGDDAISFWIQANIGERLVPIKDHASGGELARILFAIKTLLRDNNQTPTLVFDEID